MRRGASVQDPALPQRETGDYWYEAARAFGEAGRYLRAAKAYGTAAHTGKAPKRRAKCQAPSMREPVSGNGRPCPTASTPQLP